MVCEDKNVARTARQATAGDMIRSLAVILIPQLSRIFVWPARFVTEHLYNALASLFGLPQLV